MQGTQTRMIMIDEFQHFYDKGTKLIIHHVTDWLKILVGDLKGRSLSPDYRPAELSLIRTNNLPAAF
jgi:hypothetical protein